MNHSSDFRFSEEHNEYPLKLIFSHQKHYMVPTRTQVPISSLCIRAVEAKRDITFAAIGSNVMVWKRSKQLGTMRTEKENHTIVALLVFGDHLLALSSKLPSGGSLFVFDIATRELHSEIEFSSSFTPITLLHPHTYMNKVLVASREGKLQLWNVKKGKMIYEFKSIKDNAALAALAQSSSRRDCSWRSRG